MCCDENCQAHVHHSTSESQLIPCNMTGHLNVPAGWIANGLGGEEGVVRGAARYLTLIAAHTVYEELDDTVDDTHGDVDDFEGSPDTNVVHG